MKEASFEENTDQIDATSDHCTTYKDAINCPEKLMKISHFNQTNQRPMGDKDTSALREKFQYSS